MRHFFQRNRKFSYRNISILHQSSHFHQVQKHLHQIRRLSHNCADGADHPYRSHQFRKLCLTGNQPEYTVCHASDNGTCKYGRLSERLKKTAFLLRKCKSDLVVLFRLYLHRRDFHTYQRITSAHDYFNRIQTIFVDIGD